MPLRVNRDRNMQVLRCRQTQQFLQVNLPRGGIEQVGTAHDVGDALSGIVYYDRKLVCKKSIAPFQYKIADFLFDALFNSALSQVRETDHF